MTVTGLIRAGIRFSAAAATTLLLAACGGGGGGDSGGGTTTPPPPPPPPTYSIGGSVSGLSGSGLVLQNNGSDNLSIAADGNFTFATEIDDGSAYDVTVLTQPASPDQTCTIANASGTATADVTNVTVTCTTNTSTTDTDGDGLTDADEMNIYGTSVDRADTDGDGYNDFEEIVTFGFNANVNPYLYNPLIADLARFEVDVQQTPVIGANFVDTNSNSQSVATSRSQSQTTSTSTQYGVSATVGVEATASATVGASTTGPSAEVSNSVSVSASTTVSFDQTNTQENQTAWEDMQSNGIEQSTTTDGGFMRVTAIIRNTGDIPLTLSNMTLTGKLSNEGDNLFNTFARLSVESGTFPETTLPPRDPSGNSQGTVEILFENNSIDTGTIRDLLTSTRSITIDQETINVTNADGTSLPYVEQLVTPVTAKVLIDYGQYRESEFYQVATIIDIANPGRRLVDILTETLQVPFTDDGNGLSSVRGITSNSGGRWVITTKRDRGASFEVEILDPEDTAYVLDDIIAQGNDEILLVLLEDEDGDGLGYREELIHGTDPAVSDTDGDGLTDFEEVRESWTVTALRVDGSDRYPSDVFSSPISRDFDGDSLEDPAERNDGLDPFEADTDGDGTPDNLDNDNGGDPLVATLPVYVGAEAGIVAHSDYAINLNGSITARGDQALQNATISWGDGSADLVFGPFTGGNPSLAIAERYTYPAAGTYTITLNADDDAAPENTLSETATVVLTDPVRPFPAETYSYSVRYYGDRHIRTLTDIDSDGFDDLVVVSNSVTQVSKGSPSGLGARETWDSGAWAYGNRATEPELYANVAAEPRFFADINGDGDLDIIGVNATGAAAAGPVNATVEYGINNGTGFETPTNWLVDIEWDEDRDEAFIVDINNDGFNDFVHSRAADGRLIAYTSNGASLMLTERTPLPFPAIDAGEPQYPARADYTTVAADLDNDGCVDFTLFGNDATYYARSQCNGNFDDWVVIIEDYGLQQDYLNNTEKRWVDDVNGDDFADIVVIGPTAITTLLNTSTVGSISFGVQQTLTDNFSNNNGYADVRVIDGVNSFNVYPRYLADINNDGFKDIVAFAGIAAAIGVNRLGIDGELAFADGRTIAGEFDTNRLDANGDDAWWGDDSTSCEVIGSPCREYFPRIVGDIDGDGRVDLLGFDRNDTIFQSAPYVTQFE